MDFDLLRVSECMIIIVSAAVYGQPHNSTSPPPPAPPAKEKGFFVLRDKIQLINGRFKIWIDVIVNTLVNPVLLLEF